MTTTSRRLAFFVALALFLPIGAGANDHVAAYFCAPVNESRWMSFVQEIQTNGAKEAVGVTKMQAEIRQGALCIRDITVAGSFGVILVSGRSCSDSKHDFVSLVESAVGIPRQKEPSAGALASFALPSKTREPGQITVYRGDPSFEAKSNASSKSVSFMCYRSLGGSQ